VSSGTPTPPPRTPAPPGDVAPPPRQATLLELLGAVFWSFFGVRKSEAMRRDTVTIKPHQVIIVGVLCAAVLVAALLILVRLITRG
jgi:hypothetical protein